MSIQGAYGYQLREVGRPLSLAELPPLEPLADEVVVKVAGCGVCHTDLGFAYDGVPTRHQLPLVLGHEVTGQVVATGEQAQQWQGRNVIVPAVIACGQCPACRSGRPTICRKQFMPGNDGDGGFASHMRVPARGLCPVPQTLPAGLTLEALSVVADAVTTPFEAIRRSGLRAGEVAVIVGAGGIGGFAVQIAAALGAKTIAVDIDQERLDLAQLHGAYLALNSTQYDEKKLKASVRSFASEFGTPGATLKIFEMSGTTGGQATAFGLLDFGAYLGIVGYTPKKIEVRLSNLMAFDAIAQGNWGCPAEQYPSALQLVLDGKIVIEPFIERHKLEEVPEIMEGMAKHEFRHRVVLMPNGREAGPGEDDEKP